MPQHFIAYKLQKYINDSNQQHKLFYKKALKQWDSFILLAEQKLGSSPLKKSNNTLKIYPNAADK